MHNPWESSEYAPGRHSELRDVWEAYQRGGKDLVVQLYPDHSWVYWSQQFIVEDLKIGPSVEYAEIPTGAPLNLIEKGACAVLFFSPVILTFVFFWWAFTR
jgi:hypothetical protein